MSELRCGVCGAKVEGVEDRVVDAMIEAGAFVRHFDDMAHPSEPFHVVQEATAIAGPSASDA